MTKWDGQCVRWRASCVDTASNSNHASGYFKRLIQGGDFLLLRFVDRRDSGQGLPLDERSVFPSLILFDDIVRRVNE